MYEIIQFIDRSKDEPLSCLDYPVPRSQAPERWVKYYVNKFGDGNTYVVGTWVIFPARYPRATYAAMVSH